LELKAASAKKAEQQWGLCDENSVMKTVPINLQEQRPARLSNQQQDAEWI
jgi:hypothetical protein